MTLMDEHLAKINGKIVTELIRDNITPIIAITIILLHENNKMLLSFGIKELKNKSFIPEDFYTLNAQPT